ncbi:MAG: hypothetical protein ACI9VR_001222 [Cognaticolwellia sp.]|jgi:hypothetical protein
MTAPTPELIADVTHLRGQLGGIATRARTLAWNDERPWRPDTHVWGESGTPTVDLHDLSVRIAVECVQATVDQVGILESGAVVFVTGRGSHSIGGQSPLKEAVTQTLLDAAQDNDWRLRSGAPGRLVLVVDETAANAQASGRLGPVAWAAILLFALSLIYVLVSGVLG